VAGGQEARRQAHQQPHHRHHAEAEKRDGENWLRSNPSEPERQGSAPARPRDSLEAPRLQLAMLARGVRAVARLVRTRLGVWPAHRCRPPGSSRPPGAAVSWLEP